jgi:hypothetical protein
MDSYSSILNEEKSNNRSDPSRMNNKTQTPLAQLRPDILGDAAVKDRILMIQKTCKDVDPEIIALVFHECNQNMQKTIARIKAGELQDGEWQTAKSTNKKKSHNNNHNQGDQILNGSTLSDSERSLSQRTSPASSLRSGPRRNDQYQHPSSIRTDGRRRGNDSGRNQFNYSRYSARNNPTHKPNPPLETPLPNEISLPSKQSNENIPPMTSSLIDEYEFVDGSTQSLTFDNSQKKISIPPSSSKRRIPSAISQMPVSMHPTVQFSTEPIDIQFGDIQWNDSVPTAVSPSSDHEEEISSIGNTENHDIQDTLSTNYINHQPTNDTNNQLSSSLSIIDHTISNNLPIVSPDGTSHLSDHLSPTSSSIANQYSSQSQEPIQIPITRLPPTSQYIPNNLQQNNTNTTSSSSSSSSALTPFNLMGNYPSVPREYSQTTNWNPQSSNYKINSKTAMVPTRTYPQQQQTSYQIPPQQQQQIFFGAYQYPVVQFLTPIEPWSPTGYSTPLESYPYATANYVPTYPNQPQYYPPTKYDQHSIDKEFFAHYGQSRLSNTDLSSQPTKDTQITSKLSPTAATFSQGASLTASPSATALYINPFTYTVPNYYPSMSGTDRTLSYSSVDNRDNRNGANNRTNYYHHGQQRTQNNNVLNSPWHSQQ